MPRKESPIQVLPQEQESWYCAVRRLRVWLEDEKNPDHFFRPYLMVMVNLNTGLVPGADVLVEPPDAKDLQKQLFKAMRHPSKELETTPHRPAEIHVEDSALVSELGALLAEAGILVRYQPERKNMDTLVKEMESTIGEVDAIPGLLKQHGVTPDQVGKLYAAAAEFYRAAPWVQLSNFDLLSIRVEPQKEPLLALVMGQGGTEYGLSIYRDLKDLDGFLKAENQQQAYGLEGRQLFSFEAPPVVSFDDIDAVEKYGWPLPAPDLYPMPIIYKADRVLRPKADMLRWYEAALRAVPIFVSEHLQTDAQGNHPRVEVEIPVQTSAGRVTVRILFPAADLTEYVGIQPRWTEELETEDAGEEFGPLEFDQRVLERTLAQAGAGLGTGAHRRDKALEQAQEIMYDAWEETKPARRIALAHKALATSPDCADAYNLLAEEEARTAREALQLYQQGVEAGRRALGDAFMNDPGNVGYFWGVLETRPFMRSMAGVAQTLWEIGRREEAVATYRELLRLNPGDNQGNRYELVDLLLGLGRDAEVEKLLDQYEGDWSAEFAYSEVLLAFRKHGDSRAAKKALEQALEVNAYVPDYLTGKKRIPGALPDTITMGGEDEAVSYASGNINHWRKTPGAVDWLRENAEGGPGEAKNSPQRAQRPQRKI
jgi:tetratricopeptide (TPR) repeat protein